MINPRYINATSIHPVTDKMQIYYHVLDIAVAGLAVERGAPNASSSQISNVKPQQANSGNYTPQQGTVSSKVKPYIPSCNMFSSSI